MSSARRPVKRTIPTIKTPISAQLMALRPPNKGLIGSVTICLIFVLLLIWKFAPANSTPKMTGTSTVSASVTSFIDETADISPRGASSLLTPIDASDPGTVGNSLLASVPAHTAQPGARFRRVVDKKIAHGVVTLTLRDEQTGELSTMTQPLGTNVDIQANGGKATALASTSVSAKPLDPVKAELPTQGIETIKAGMTANDIASHVANATEVWQTAYRGSDRLFHIVGNKVVVTQLDGTFESAWRATVDQLTHYRTGIRIK